MSQAELIRQGQIAEKKQARNQAVFSAAAALKALLNAAVYARNKPVEDINTAEMTAHLEQLVAKQEEVQRIDAEIKDLNY